MKKLNQVGLETKLRANISAAKELGLRVYVCYCNNNLVASYTAKNMDSAYAKMKFNLSNNYNFIEVMQLKNKETINSPDVFDMVKELFGKSFIAQLNAGKTI